MFRIKMIWSSVGLFLAVALVNTQGLSIHGEESVSINGDEVEQELDVSRVLKKHFNNKNWDLHFQSWATQVLEGMLGMGAGSRVKRDDRGITNYDIRSVRGLSTEEIYLSPGRR